MPDHRAVDLGYIIDLVSGHRIIFSEYRDIVNLFVD